MLGLIDGVAVDVEAEAAAIDAVERRLEHALDIAFGAPAIGDQIRNGPDLQAVKLGKGDQVRQPRHGAVVVHDLADHPGRLQAGEPRDVHRRLGVAGADQHPALLGHQGEDVPGRDQVVRALGRIDGDRHGARAVVGRDAGGDPFLRLDRHGEGGAVQGLVVGGHGRQPQLARPFGGDGQADQAARVLGHEVDLVGGGELGGDDHIPLVLAILGVDQDEGPPLLGVLDDVLDG